MCPLGRDFYLQDAETVARQLLGKLLVRKVGYEQLILRITETEAYLGIDDPACHSYKNRKTARTAIMYNPGGYSYVYFIYGMYNMLNAVTGREGDPCAVLIRAGRPVVGMDAISRGRFGKPWKELTPLQRRALSDGPGKLCKALNISREQNGLDLTASELTICEGEVGSAFRIEAGPRIGIDYAGEAANWPLNFKLRDIVESPL